MSYDRLSDEYLTEILSCARRQLPGWVYAGINRMARLSVSEKSCEPSIIEKLALSDIKPSSLKETTDNDLLTTWQRLQEWFNGFSKRGLPTDEVETAARRVMAEMNRRDMEIADSALTNAVQVEKQDIQVFQTSVDEGHSHEVVFPIGEIDPTTKKTSESDDHTHTVRIPEKVEVGEKLLATTTTDQKHHHTLMVVPSADGSTIKSDTDETDESDCCDPSVGVEKQRAPANIQTLIFDKEKFDKEKATAWLKEHDFKMTKEPDETGSSFRFRQVDPGRFVDGSFRTIKITDGVKAVIGRLRKSIAKSQIDVPNHKPENAVIAFVGASPSKMESARHEPFVSKSGLSLNESYLEPLGLHRDQVLLGNVVPNLLKKENGSVREPDIFEITEWIDWIEKELEDANPKIVVALGQTAKTALGERADFVLPHPASTARFARFADETRRKLKQIKKRLDLIDKDSQINHKSKEAQKLLDKPGQSADEISGMRRLEPLVPIVKADPIKQIVYGVVLSPYGKDGATADAHNDWNPPASVEESAHAFMKGRRVIGFQHQKKANAEVVETWVEQYPQGEYKKAMRNQDHRVWRRPFGTDVVHSGDWCLGVKLGETEWKAFQSGDINAFSPAGLGVRTPITRSQMPRVTFIDLVEKPPSRK